MGLLESGEAKQPDSSRNGMTARPWRLELRQGRLFRLDSHGETEDMLEGTRMNRNLAAALQVLTVLLGLGALAFLLWEPHVEGRNAHATLFQIYFHDPFLAYAYTGSIAFFTALYQVFRLLGYVATREGVSSRSVKALRTLKRCALMLIAFLMGAEVYLHGIQRAKGEDIAGGVMIGLVLMVASAGVAIVAARLERSLRTAMERRSA